ncbi:MAG: hypothetical protein GY950_01860, partial [bacterium]|nr:hypothetical protein [bacterium]
MSKKTIFTIFTVLVILMFSPLFHWGSDTPGVFSPNDVLNTRTCGAAAVSPDGKWIAYTVGVGRDANDKPGGAYRELYLISTQSRQIKPFITGKVNVGTLRWRPDGSALAFTTRRGEKAKNQVWLIPVDGGEAMQLTHCKSGVKTFRWHPKENKIAFIAVTPKSEKEKKLEKKGYGFIFYEENLKHRNLYVIDLDNKDKKTNVKQLTKGK